MDLESDGCEWQPDTRVALVILDGLGLSNSSDGDVVSAADTPVLCDLWNRYPRTVLRASGKAVGLSHEQMGNSNVGHLHLGSGRIIPQDVRRIDRSIENGEFYQKPVLRNAMDRTRQRKTALHLMGLASDGLVHSSLDHLMALIELARRKGVDKVHIHAFLDGRDVPPTSAEKYLRQIEEEIADDEGYEIATVSGRYYAMDRDNRWDRIDRVLCGILRAEGRRNVSSIDALHHAYDRGEKDEFVVPTVLSPYGGYRPGDVFIFFNFRADRARQLSRALLEPSLDLCDCRPLEWPCDLVTMTQYDENFGCPVVFEPMVVKDTLGEVISCHGLRQLRLAETEKYAHVTYFMNGGREKAFCGEERIMVPSPAVSTYDKQPAMSAQEVTRRFVTAVKKGDFDFIVVNFANPDMVGHTGDMEAAIEAVETIDKSLQKVVEAAADAGYVLFIVSDHGNVEKMMDEFGYPHTAHTVNGVPFIMIDSKQPNDLHSNGGLIDVAPTLLDLMNIPIPDVMEGSSLLLRGGRCDC